jgi:hypothetical protein
MGVETLYHGIIFNETPFDVEVLIVELVGKAGKAIDMFTIPAGDKYEIDLPAGYYVIAAKCPAGVIYKEYDIPTSLFDPTKPFSIRYFMYGGRKI